MEEDKIRLEALKLAIKSYGDAVKHQSVRSIEYRSNDFYNYITTGRMND